jgi:rod shape-determining protein MreC
MNRLNIALVVAVVAVAIYLSALSPASMQSLQSGFLSLLSPFLKTGTAVQQNIGSVGERLKNLDELEVENKKLLTENRELRAANNLLVELESENNKLRMALDYRRRSSFKLVPARIIARDSSTWWNTVRINRGFEDGVESDQPVMTETGLVGKTTTVSKNEANVVLITDETCRIGAKIEGTREQGIISGIRVQENASGGILQLNFLSKNAKVEPGQQVLTAGVTHGSFPPGVVIGKVKEFIQRPLDGQAIVEPVVNLAGTEDVFVLVGKK